MSGVGIRALVVAALVVVGGCSGTAVVPPAATADQMDAQYLIGPGDNLNIFVWRNPELSATVPVRPDGRISTPLVEDVVAVGKTPTELARTLEGRLKKFVRDPIVTVMVSGFVGDFSQQVRVIGEAVQPRAVPYRQNMTLLDVMIQVGGLTKFADGNGAVLIRKVKGQEDTFPVRLDNLIKDGEIRYNFRMEPGDTLIIPQSAF